MDSIPEELHETAVPCNLDLQNDMTRTLGLIWHPENDILQYNVTSHGNSNWTKRTEDSKIIVNLLASKSRVARLKRVTLPRLELCGALLLSHLMEKVSTAINLRDTSKFYWTDSTVVLAWIAGSPTSWKTCVANRVSEIQKLSEESDWRHEKF